MATQAVDLGRFAPAQGPTSRWALAGGLMGLGAAAVVVVAFLADLAGSSFDSRPTAVPAGAAAILVSMAGLYQVATAARKARGAAVWGASLGALAAIVSLIHGAVVAGTLELERFGIAYFDREILSAIWRDVLGAAANTLKYAAISEAFGIALGLVLAVLTLSKRQWLRVPAIGYVDVMRGLPLLMTIILVLFAPTFVGITLPSLTAGLVALSLNSGAYVAEIFRAGIQAVERGQMDAARSLGMPYATAMIHVVIPQAVRKVIPPLTNEFIALVKDTSLLFVGGFVFAEMELLSRARTLAASTFSATPFMAASLAYLVITLPLIRLVTMLERRLLGGEQGGPIRARLLRTGRGDPAGA